MERRAPGRWTMAGAAGVLGLAGPIAGQCHYTVTVIRHECNETTTSPTRPTALNDAGQVCGYVNLCVTGPYRPFGWTEESGLQLLPVPPGTVQANAYDIGSDGRIVGEIVIENPLRRRAFIYDQGTWTELPPAGPDGSGMSSAAAIGEDGTIVGYRTIDGPGNPSNAFTWHPQTGFTDFGLLGGTRSTASAIRNGRVVGWTHMGPYDIGFMMVDGSVAVLGPITDGTTSKPTGIGPAGEACGAGRIVVEGTPFGRSRAFVWTGAFQVLDPFPGYERSWANAISTYGVVVGQSWTDSGVGTIWMNGQIINVNDLIETELSLTVTDIVDVNASGQLLAQGHTPAVVALRLDPIDPSPADLDGDCDTDQADMQRLFDAWGSSDSIADLNVDGVVDALDFLFLLAHWSA